MLEISRAEIKAKLARDNPWWTEPESVDEWMYADLPHRAYFHGFYSLCQKSSVRRAVVLMGPRRVGKTVMLHQAIHQSIKNEVAPRTLLYVSIDHPVYTGMALEQFVMMLMERNGLTNNDRFSVFFDEIQYLRDWEVHLKGLVDSYPNARFVASGSAAAALRLKSEESGAGRFTDFMLPPLTFAEFLQFTEKEDALINYDNGKTTSPDIKALNMEFINYLNHGGYPEAVLSSEVRGNVSRFIQKDIVDKSLLKDLPSLYGIGDVQELNKLFSVIAYNTAQEFSYTKLSNASGVGKDTIRRYIEYLEAAFLITKVVRIDDSGKSFQRERSFKLYLTNPSIRSALFSPVTGEDEGIGHLVETAIFSQWFHSDWMRLLRYARWKSGEVDLVAMDSATLRPDWALEVKWTDRFHQRPDELGALLAFARKTGMANLYTTTRTVSGNIAYDHFNISYEPSSLYCYWVGKTCVHHRLATHSLKETR